ncbi:MAG: ABC transporter permease, partial [Chloroflexota bacterium]
MKQLLAAEFFKLRKRQLSWILLLIAAIFTGFIYALFLIIVLQGDAMTVEGGGMTDFEEMTALRNAHIFGFGIIHQTMAVVAVILTVLSITSEFSWRTIITMISWTGERQGFLIAKLIVVCGFIAAGTLLCWLVAASGSLGIEILNGTISSDGLDARWLVDIIASYGRTTIAIIIFAMTAAALAAVTRSTAIAIGLTLVVLYV